MMPFDTIYLESRNIIVLQIKTPELRIKFKKIHLKHTVLS